MTTTKTRKITIPEYRSELEALFDAAVALAESKDEDAQAVARRARWLKEVRPRGA
jgi:hypothetical protein